MTTSTLDRPHIWQLGSGETDGTPLLLLHGTGGDEHDLLPLAGQLAPAAPVLSARGSVTENGMPRFFQRLREGVFDEDDLHFRVDELVAFLTAAETEYGVSPGTWRAVGFSNGANIAAALLLQRPGALATAVLLAAPWCPSRNRRGGSGRHAGGDQQRTHGSAGHSGTNPDPERAAARP